MKTNKISNRILFQSPTVQAGWEAQSHITDFKLDKKQLGSGSFGTVFKAVNKKNNKIYAIKQIKKSELDSKKLIEHAAKQVEIMYKLNHPSIIKLYNHFEDQISIYLVLEFAANGQLYSFLKSQPQRKFSQKVAAKYIKQIAQGIKQIHSKKIMHRDLKLQNILVDENNNMKIADFGWSQFVDPDKRTTYCGTLDYLAPEMVQKGHKHDERVDIWSIGVLIYQLCTGSSPFSCNLTGNDISIQNVKKNIKNVIYEIPSNLSNQCKKLIKGILKKNPEERPSIQQILNSSWIQQNNQGNGKRENLDFWLQNIKNQMKQMFPQQTILLNNNENNIFSKQQIYKYTRPDSIINLKPKKKKEQALTSPSNLTEKSFSPVSSSQMGQLNTPSNFTSNFQYKKMSQLQLRILQLEFQSKKDQEQIKNLREQLMQSKFKATDHKECKNQIKQLMEQIVQQNRAMEQLNWKLNESQRKVTFLQREKMGL